MFGATQALKDEDTTVSGTAHARRTFPQQPFPQLVVAGGLLLAVAGCCGWGYVRPNPEPSCPVCFDYYGAPMCFGYYSTCWRSWPEECPPCPTYAHAPSTEAVPPGSPAPAPPAPLEEGAPAVPPAPAPAPLPVPMPPAPQGAGVFEQASPAGPTSAAAAMGRASSRRTWTEAHFTGRPLR
jgi:hypothetical protein